MNVWPALFWLISHYPKIHPLFIFPCFLLKIQPLGSATSTSNTDSSYISKSPIHMHLLQQEMIQRLSEGEVEQDCSMRLFHQVITAQTIPPLTRPPSHKAEQCVRNERNPLERNECLVNNKPRPC